MNLIRNNKILILISLLILAAIFYFWYPKMTSKYHTDFGNGVVIYADKYVNSGQWVYDCKTTRLISKQPLKFPVSDLEESGNLDINTARQLGEERENAKSAIKSVTSIKDWYKNLEYNYSALSQSDSEISAHVYSLIADHNGEEWAVFVDQGTDIEGNLQFKIRARIYDQEEFIDHKKALALAANSCGT